MGAEPVHVSPREAADKLGVSVSTVWRLIRDERLPVIQATPPDKPGLKPRTRITEAALEAFVQAHSRVA